MKIKAVIDRIDGDKVVILAGQEQQRLVVPKTMFPSGAKEGDWFKAEIEDDHVFGVEPDKEETEAAKKRIADKLEQLRKR